MMTIDKDVVLMIKKMETSSQDADSMMINQDVALMIEKTVTLNLNADLTMPSQDVDLMIEKMVTIDLNADLTIKKMVISNQEDVLMMTNQIVDTENKHARISD